MIVGGSSRGQDPGSPVENKDDDEDDGLEDRALGVADPAEDGKRQKKGAPVGRLDVFLDRRVLGMYGCPAT